MDFAIEFEPNLSAEDENIIYEGLLAHNVEDLNLPLEQIRTRRFAFVVRQSGVIQAGLVGNTKFTSAFIDILWVNKSWRKKGLGQMLLRRAEEYVQSINCSVVFLNTLTRKNVRFYENAGYVLEFERPGYLGAHAMRYFRKDFVVGK